MMDTDVVSLLAALVFVTALAAPPGCKEGTDRGGTSSGQPAGVDEPCFNACLDSIAMSPRDLMAFCPKCAGQTGSANQYKECMERTGCTQLVIDHCMAKCTW